MDLIKWCLTLLILFFTTQGLAENVTIRLPEKDSDYDDTVEIKTDTTVHTAYPDPKDLPEIVESEMHSELVYNKYLRLNNYVDNELDQHALRIAANCAPLAADGKYGAVALPLDDVFYIVPTKPSSLPPLPGEEGRLGLHGIDVNKNCVRDDIEHYIFAEFPEEDQEQFRLYLYEYAIWLNFFLIENISEKTAQATTRQTIKVASCLYSYRSYAFSNPILDDIFAKLHNSAQRTEQYFASMEKLTGYILEGDIGSIC